MSDLAAALIEHAPGGARESLEKRSDLAQVVAGLLAEGDSRWAMPAETFAGYVGARLPDDGSAATAIDALHGADLALACACAANDDAAVRAFEQQYGSHIEAIVRRFQASTALLEEAAQRVRQQLLVAPPDKQPKIAQYRGTGTLLAFIRIVTVRVAMGMLRKRSEHPATEEETWAMPSPEDDPELRYLKELYRAEFKAAFEAGMERLTPRERSLLKYQLVDRLSIDKVAAIYGIHRSTAARQIDKARQALIEHTRAAMKGQLDLQTDELQSVMRLIQSNVEVSAVRLLSR